MSKPNEIKKVDTKQIKNDNIFYDNVPKNSKLEEKGGMFRPSSPFKITKGKMSQQSQQSLNLFNETKTDQEQNLDIQNKALKSENIGICS